VAGATVQVEYINFVIFSVNRQMSQMFIPREKLSQVKFMLVDAVAMKRMSTPLFHVLPAL